MSNDNVLYFILDMDGVLVEYRYKDKVYMTPKELRAIGNFLNRNAVDYILEALIEFRKYNKIEFHVLSVAYTEEIQKEKEEWLRVNARFISQGNYHFVRSAEEKVEYLEELFGLLSNDHKIVYNSKLDRSNVILIDDTHKTLYEVEQKGFTVWHPTTLLNLYYHKMHLGTNTKTVM
jgi:5'(3')-deoxyribonucleotidase